MGTTEAWANLTDSQIADAVRPSGFPKPFSYRLKQWQPGHPDRTARCMRGLWSGAPDPDDLDLYIGVDETIVARAKSAAEEVLRTLTQQPVRI